MLRLVGPRSTRVGCYPHPSSLCPGLPGLGVGDHDRAGQRCGGRHHEPAVDASHGNSRKDHTRQPLVAAEIAEQVAGGNESVAGVMLESFLVAGRQDLDPTRELVHGQSITDACMDWATTERVLDHLHAAVLERRTG